MILKYNNFNFNIDLKGISTIIIENPKMYREFIMDIHDLEETDSEESSIKVFNNFELINMKNKIIFLDSIFDLDVNDKKIINSLYSNIENKILDEEYEKYSKIEKEILSFFNNIIIEEHLDVISGDSIDIKELVKVSGIRFDSIDYKKEVIEKLIQYMEIIQRYTKYDVIILNNIRSMFEETEWNIFVNDLIKKEIVVICIENHNLFNKIEGEKLYIIDKDLCEIY